jgi:hypothetical protein
VAPGSDRGAAHGRGGGADTGGRSAAAKQRSCQRRKKRGGPRDLVGNCKNFRDCTINKNFPLIQSSNEKMVNKKAVELFKTYNFTLGLKFRNLKHTVLFYYFALKSNFNKSYPTKTNFINFWAYLQAFMAGDDDIHLFHFDPW